MPACPPPRGRSATGHTARSARALTSKLNATLIRLTVGGTQSPIVTTRIIPTGFSPLQEHRVTITEKAIAIRHRVTVGRKNCGRAAERTCEHQERRAGQVEVGDQRIHHPEAIARRDEEIRVALEWCDCAGAGTRSRGRARPWCQRPRCARRRREPRQSPRRRPARRTRARHASARRRAGIRAAARRCPHRRATSRPRADTPCARSRSSSGPSKCRPAVGAATEPGMLANTVW